MGSKNKESIAAQKTGFEKRLNERRASLAGKGVAPEKIAKDTVVRNMKSRIREMAVRERTIAAIEKKTEELGKLKVEKLEAAKRLKEEKAKGPEGAPAKEKKEKAKAPKEASEKGKEKKKKKSEAQAEEGPEPKPEE